MALPNWIQPTDLVGAASRGAQLGLSLRSQDMAAAQHAAQLALEEDRINLAQQNQAVQYEMASQRAAEALRQHNALEAYRVRTLEQRGQIESQRAAARAEAESARRALEERRVRVSEQGLEERKKATGVSPTATVIQDPVTGKPVTVWQGGGRWQLGSQDKGQDAATKALTAIEDKSLSARQSALEKQISEAANAKEKAPLEKELLQTKTARSNLVMAAQSPMRPAVSPPAAVPAPAMTNAPAAKGGRVRVKAPSGKFGYVPSEQVDQALKEGYTLAP